MYVNGITLTLPSPTSSNFALTGIPFSPIYTFEVIETASTYKITYIPSDDNP
jgi:hypothetical protein